MKWENQWNKYIEYFNRGADGLKISIRHVSTSAILVSISKAPRSDALKSLHGGDALRAWPCTWRGTNSSKSGCRGVFRVLWDAPPRKCDGTCSTGMMGRMIGWVWWAGIAGKAWSACATTCYLCLVWMSRGVDPPNHTLNTITPYFHPTYPSVPPSADSRLPWPRACIGNVWNNGANIKNWITLVKERLFQFLLCLESCHLLYIWILFKMNDKVFICTFSLEMLVHLKIENSMKSGLSKNWTCY